ncbi:DUF4132 domain-containing protein, partial [Streptomyces sp. NPDC003832]
LDLGGELEAWSELFAGEGIVQPFPQLGRAVHTAPPGTGADAAAHIAPAAATRLLSRLPALLAEQRACWLLRSRPGGLDDSLAHFDRLRHLLTEAATR